MPNQTELRERLEKVKKNFNLPDAIGLACLIFGLVLSNSAVHGARSTATKTESSVKESVESQPEVKRKRISKRYKNKNQKMASGPK